jgi:hypothetical protein
MSAHASRAARRAAPMPPSSSRLLALLAAVLLAARPAAAYYVPGTYPQEFYERDPLQPYVNSLTSQVTEVR